jgi:DNA phosphorothioation-associated putative methyltransferase
LDWTLAHGRLPDDDELPPGASAAVAAAGSVGHAGLVLRDVFGTEPFEQAAADRRQDLTTRFAIARLRRRSKFSDLPRVVQRDVRTLFGSYKAACGHADALLFAVGDPATLRAAAGRSPVGKATSDALYVHITALDLLPAELLVYDACARVVAGAVDDANLVKFHFDKPRVSYLVYPDFDTDPHPPWPNRGWSTCVNSTCDRTTTAPAPTRRSCTAKNCSSPTTTPATTHSPA